MVLVTEAAAAAIAAAATLASEAAADSSFIILSFSILTIPIACALSWACPLSSAIISVSLVACSLSSLITATSSATSSSWTHRIIDETLSSGSCKGESIRFKTSGRPSGWYIESSGSAINGWLTVWGSGC